MLARAGSGSLYPFSPPCVQRDGTRGGGTDGDELSTNENDDDHGSNTDDDDDRGTDDDNDDEGDDEDGNGRPRSTRGRALSGLVMLC